MRPAFVLVLAALAVTLLPQPAGASGGPAWRSWDAGLREAGTSGRPMLVDVYTNWCGWCRRLDQDVYARADVQDYLARKFVSVKLDAEGRETASYQGKAYTSRTLAARLDVTGYPTILFFSAKGAYLGGVARYVSPEEMLLLLRYVGDGHAERGETFEQFKRGAQAAATRPRR